MSRQCSEAQRAQRRRFAALARVMQRMSRWQRTPKQLAALRRMSELAKEKTRRPAYPPPPNGIPHPFTKTMRYTLHYGDGLLRFCNRIEVLRRYPHGCVVVDNVTGRWRVLPGPWQAPTNLSGGGAE